METKWCYACTIPAPVLKEVGQSHVFYKCPWNDTILGVAWMVWHSPLLFEEMTKAVPCHLNAVHGYSNDDSKKEWFRWLVSLNEEQSGYNMHDLWIWYFKSRIEASLN